MRQKQKRKLKFRAKKADKYNMSTTENTTTTHTTGVAFRCANCKAARRVEFLTTTVRTSRELDGRMIENKHTTWDAMQPVEIMLSYYGSASGVPIIKCIGCGLGRMTGRPIEGRVTLSKCGSKCTHSRGHVCECECGGANHGKKR